MNFKQTKRFILTLPIKQAVLLEGMHGLGKSDCVREAAIEMGGTCIDIRLSQNDVGDLKGMPFMVNGRTEFAPPAWFPMDEEAKDRFNIMLKAIGQKIIEGNFGPTGILFFDELNRATREVEQVAFQVVLDRILNFIKLPEGWRVVAAINGDTEVYNVNEIEPALLSRFAVVPFAPTVDEWLEHAKERKAHPAVIHFITSRNECLDVKKDVLTKGVDKGQKFYDRRSWIRLSEAIQSFEAQDPEWLLNEKDFRLNVFMAFIGSLMATQFNRFVEAEYVTLNAKKILNNWDKSVEKHLAKAQVSELAGYNTLIVDYIKEDAEIQKNGKMNKKQSENLLKYIEATMNEIGSDFWSIFNKQQGVISTQWYENMEGAKEMICGCLAAPKALKNQGMPTKKQLPR